jgi:hypothetical protein
MLPENDALSAPDALSDRGPDGGEGARASSSADELPPHLAELARALFEALFLAAERHALHPLLSVEATESWLHDLATRAVLRAPTERIEQIWLPLLREHDHLIEAVEADILGDGRFDAGLLGEEAQAIAEQLRRSFETRHAIDLSTDTLALRRIGLAAQGAVQALGGSPRHVVELPFLAASRTGPRHLVATLERTLGPVELTAFSDDTPALQALEPRDDHAPDAREAPLVEAVAQQFLADTGVDVRRSASGLPRVRRAVRRALATIDATGARQVELNLPFVARGAKGPERLRMVVVPPETRFSVTPLPPRVGARASEPAPSVRRFEPAGEPARGIDVPMVLLAVSVAALLLVAAIYAFYGG